VNKIKGYGYISSYIWRNEFFDVESQHKSYMKQACIEKRTICGPACVHGFKAKVHEYWLEKNIHRANLDMDLSSISDVTALSSDNVGFAKPECDLFNCHRDDNGRRAQKRICRTNKL
jgi:hypothetical protein